MASRAEAIRREIMDQCYAHRPMARDAERMALLCRREGEMSDASAAEFEREAAYLQGRGLIEAIAEDLAKSHKRWTITAAGIDHVESEGHFVKGQP